MKRIEFMFGAAKVLLDPADGERVCMYQTQQAAGFEPESRKAWSEFAGKGTVIDCGAYTGLYAIAAAKLGAERVIAIEPMPAIVQRLRKNLHANRVLDKVEVMECAADDKPGYATIRFTPAMRLSAGASLSNVKSANPLSLKVRTIRLDSLEQCDALKIDVERHEAHVLAGADALLRRCRPIILLECFDEDDRRQTVMDLLPGYRVDRELDGRNLLLRPVQEAESGFSPAGEKLKPRG